jgi:hypothetical protein
VGGVGVAITVEQVVGTRDRARQGASVLRVGPAGGIDESRDVAQVAGDSGTEVGGLGEAAAAIGPGRAQVGRAQQLADGAQRVAAEEVGVCDLLQECGDVLIGPGRGFGEVPGVARGIGRAAAGEDAVGAAACSWMATQLSSAKGTRPGSSHSGTR